MMKVEKGDTVVFNYVGRFEDGEVFDTSYEDVAKSAGVYVEEREYGPIEARVGEGEIIPGLEEALIGMEKGEKKVVSVPPEKGYGMPRGELRIPVSPEQFSSTGLEPVEGMYVMTDAGMAKIVSVSEKAVLLDFNHPLAGKTVTFEIEVVDVKKGPD